MQNDEAKNPHAAASFTVLMALSVKYGCNKSSSHCALQRTARMKFPAKVMHYHALRSARPLRLGDSRAMLTKIKLAPWSLVASSISTNPDWMEPGDAFMIIDDETIEKDWGWVFFDTSKLWWQTTDFRYAIAGNAPAIVERGSGRLVATGTARSIEHYIAVSECTGDPHA